MCKSFSLDKYLYGNKNLVSYLNKVEHTTNLIDPTDKELIEFLQRLFGRNYTDVPLLSPFIQNWIEARILKQSKLNTFVRQSFQTTMKDNAYNFAIAKSYNFLDGLKTLSKLIDDKDELINKQKQFSNLIFSNQQKIEDYQVEHMTDLINTVDGSEGNLLEYVSERDGKVRPEHKEQDGTIRDKIDPYWTKAVSLLSEWNCRCSIEQAPKNSKMTVAKDINNSKTKYQPSEIDFQKGKAIIFNEELPVFQNTPAIIRQRFKKEGF
jgi:hypothetical protein